MTKRLLLVFILLCCFLKVEAQGRVQPFEDYTKCYVGFIKDRKDTLWPAQFESAIPAMTIYRNQENIGWIVKFHGYYGVIDLNGEIAVPFVYDEIHSTFDSNSFIAVKNGKVGIISRKGEVKVSLNYQSIMLQNANYNLHYYLVFDNGLKGMINDQLEWVCQPIYQEIEMVDRIAERYYKQSDEFYFHVQDSLHVGLLSFRGKLVLPLEFDRINDLLFTDWCDSLTNFWQVIKDNKVGLYNASFEELAAPVWQDLEVFSALGDTCGAQVRNFARFKNGEKFMVMDLNSRKRSKIYDYVENAGNYHLVKSKNRYGVLDEQLNELPIRTKRQIALFSSGGDLYTHNSFDERETGVVSFVMDEEVIALKSSEKTNKQGRYQRAQFGLYNYRTQETVEPRFDVVFRKRINGESFFFGFDNVDNESEKGQLFVYNSTLELLHRYDYSDYSQSTIEYFFYCQQKGEKLLILRDRNGNYGGINGKGELVIPFEYTEFESTRNDLYHSCKVTAWILTKEAKKGISSPDGKMLLPVDYDEIIPRQHTFYEVRKGTDYGLVDSNFRVLIDGCNYLTIASSIGLDYGHIYLKEHYETLGEYLYYAVRNDTLFVLQQMEFKKVGGLMISSKEDVSIVGNQILLRKDGRVIQTGGRVEKITPTLFAAQRKDTLWLYDQKGGFLNEIGKVGYFSKQAEWLQLMGVKNTSGAADLVSGKVLVEPVWASIVPFIRDGKPAKDLFWVQQVAAVSNATQKWYLINTSSEKVVDIAFDYPIGFDYSGPVVFRSGSLFGLINKDLQIVVPATYSQIRKLGKHYFLQKGMWSVYSPEKGIIELNAYSIATDVHPKGFVLFGYESMGILGHNLEWITPFTPITTAKRDLNLLSLLGITGYDSWQGKRNSYFIVDTNARLFNNQFILEIAQTRSTRYSVAENERSNWHNDPYFSVRPDELRDLEINIHLWNANYLSVTRRYSSSPWSYYIARRYDFDRWSTTTIEHATYLRSDTSFAKLELKDFFTEGSNYTQLIDQFLTNYINKRQLYGVNCVNLTKILDDYKKNFYLTNEGFVFCQPNTDSNAIILRYGDLKGVLKE